MTGKVAYTTAQIRPDLLDKPVSVRDLQNAIEWLGINEAFDQDDDEGWSCMRVANMLQKEVERRQDEALVRAAVVAAGGKPTPYQMKRARQLLRAKGMIGKR